jgi:MFS family permease
MTELQTRSSRQNFRLLWTGQTVSLFGTAVTAIALPIVAVLQLHASTFAVALITGAEFLAYSVLGLPAGAYVDRWPRRPILLWSDAVRAVVVVAVPVLWLTDQLRLWHLVVAALLIGIGKMFFDTAHQAYLPALVSKDELIRRNSALQTSTATMELAGPGIGGILVQAMGAALALLVDAVSYVVSFVVILAIRPPAEEPPPPAGATLRAQIAEGLRQIKDDPMLRSLASAVGQYNLLTTAQQAIVVVFLLRVVSVPPAAVGFLLAATGVGALVGALGAGRLVDRLGLVGAMLAAATVGPVLGVLIPFTTRGPGLALFVIGNVALGATAGVLRVVGTSYRQASVPPRLLGRVVATNRVLTWGPLPLGALLGGVLGEALGVRAALLVVALLLLTEPLWVLTTPAWRNRHG